MKSENGGPSQGVRGSLRVIRTPPVDPHPKKMREVMRRLGLEPHDVRLVLVFLGEMKEDYENDEDLLEAIFSLEE